MPLVGELELPSLDYGDPDLRGERFHAEMARIAAGGWLAGSPFGWFFVLDREAATHFLRARGVEFPSSTVAAAFGITEGPLHEAITKNIISTEGDDHRRLRNLVNPAFTPRAAERWRPSARGHIAELWAAVAAHGSCELVEAVAKPYPARMIASLVGAPLADADRLGEWAGWFQRQFDPEAMIVSRDRIEAAIVEFRAYTEALIVSRREDPGDDLISTLLAATDSGDRLSEDECVHLTMNVVAGGVDTTQAQLAHGIRLMATHPEQWARLGREPELIPRAVEEILRFEPITPFTARMTTEETEHRGVSFPAGTVLMISTFTGNRDPATYERPLDLDLGADRGKSKPMTFGAGIHNCLGASLARVELQEALAYLAPRMCELALDGEPAYESVAGVYGLGSLPIRFRAAAV